MKRVAPWLRPSWSRESTRGRGKEERRRAPRLERTAGRGRSGGSSRVAGGAGGGGVQEGGGRRGGGAVGSSRVAGAPERRAFQKERSRSREGPERWARSQAAKSAYWMERGASVGGRPERRAS